MPFGSTRYLQLGGLWNVQCSTCQQLLNDYEKLVHAFFFTVTAVKDQHGKDSSALGEVSLRCENARNHLERHKLEHGGGESSALV